jgi:hypothetical protein
MPENITPKEFEKWMAKYIPIQTLDMALEKFRAVEWPKGGLEKIKDFIAKGSDYFPEKQTLLDEIECIISEQSRPPKEKIVFPAQRSLTNDEAKGVDEFVWKQFKPSALDSLIAELKAIKIDHYRNRNIDDMPFIRPETLTKIISRYDKKAK